MGGKNKSSSQQTSNSMNAGNGANVSSGVGMNYGVNQSGQQSSNQSSSQGSSFNSSQSSQDVWGAQQPHLENVYNSAGDAYSQAQQGINNLQPGVSQSMADSLAQAQGGYGNQMGGGFAAGLQGQVGPNSYVNALAGDMMNDAAKIKQQNLGGLDARAAASGMSGSTGYHNSVNQMASNVDEQTMQGINNLKFNAYNQGVQNNMNLANMMDRNQQGAMGNLQNMQAGAMNQFNPHMMGLQAAGAYGNIIGGPTVLGQSSSVGGSQNSSQASGSSSGFSNGMNVGMNMSGGQGFNNNYGGSSGQGTGNSSGWNIAPPSFSFVSG